MKINKKLLIPVFATAMGLSVVGGISGAVAWYQFNTKVEASWMGASVADGGSILISNEKNSSDEDVWERSIIFGASNASKTLHPVTFPGYTGAGIPEGAKKHPEYGVEDPDEWDAAVLGTDYYQYTFKLKTQKIVDNEYKGFAAAVKVKEFVLEATDETNKADAKKAVRVHFNAGDNKDVVYSTTGATTTLGGPLDLNGDGKADYHGGYAWDTDFDEEYDYGDKTKSLESTELAQDLTFFTTDNDGILEVTMTIWMEGWVSMADNDMSMWDPETTGGATIHFGITFGIEESDLGIE